jgi:tetratricopeptide (TPR) repeat protein
MVGMPLRSAALRTLSALSLLSLLAGCSAHSTRRGQPGQLQIQVAESTPMQMDLDLSKVSDGLHSFMVGQLAYGKADYDTAATSLARAGKLAPVPVPMIHIALAELRLKDEDLDEALKECKAALRSDPSNERLKLLKAGILQAQGKLNESLAVYLQLLKTGKPSLEAAFLAASIYGELQRFPEGIATIREYLKYAPRDNLAQYLLGLLLEGSGDFIQAEVNYSEVVKRAPDNISVEFDRLRVLLKAGKLAAAASLSEKLLTKDGPATLIASGLLREISKGSVPAEELLNAIRSFAPEGLKVNELRLKLALLQVQEQRFGDAVRELSILIASEPENSIARYYRASIYGGAGRKKDAYQDLFAIRPGQELFIKSRTFAAFLMRQDKDLAGAERVVREALREEPGNRSVLSYLVLVLRDAKKYGQALKLVNSELARDPQNEKLLFNQGIIYNDLGRVSDAIAAMEQVIKVNPQNADALNFVAYALAERGVDLGRAEQLVLKAIELSPRDGFYQDTLGWIQYQRKEYLQAVETLRRASDMTGGDVIVLEHLGDSLVKIDELAEAAETYRTALESGRDQESAERSSEVSAALPRLEDKLRELMRLNPELAPPRIMMPIEQ